MVAVHFQKSIRGQCALDFHVIPARALAKVNLYARETVSDEPRLRIKTNEEGGILACELPSYGEDGGKILQLLSST